MKPEFFDVFGIPVFLFILYVSILIYQNKPLSNWIPIVLIIIATLGLIVDTIIVLKAYILK
nr:hypothetical protein [Candidatus Woesearchaeota archaeon]